MQQFRTARGRSLPLGAMALADGVNFSLLARHGTSVQLVLLPLDHTTPLAEIALDRRTNRTGDHWHILVAGLPPSFRYGWRVNGPHDQVHRFDPSVVLLDPASTALSDGSIWGAGPRVYEDSRNGKRADTLPGHLIADTQDVWQYAQDKQGSSSALQTGWTGKLYPCAGRY